MIGMALIRTTRCLNHVCTRAFCPEALTQARGLQLQQCCTASGNSAQSMNAWEIKEYGGLEKLKLNPKVSIPVIKKPDNILVKVHAASVNPIDFKQIGGYGKDMFNKMRKAQGWLKNGSEFPLTVGKDFSGEVVTAGKNSEFKSGDQVWGAMTIAGTGCFAEYVALPVSCISPKPTNISHTDAASLPYVTITSWAALCTKAGMNNKNTRGKHVLILGGSGGVGTFSVQLLKAWGANVVTTCPGDAAELVSNLGADLSVDYKSSDADEILRKAKGPGFDVILDCIGDRPEAFMPLLKKNANASYVTVVTDLLKRIDKHGYPIALSISALTSLPQLIQGKMTGQNHHWAFAQPSTAALRTVQDLVTKEKIKPVVQQVFQFNELPTALKRLKDGGNRGKLVIEYL